MCLQDITISSGAEEEQVSYMSTVNNHFRAWFFCAFFSFFSHLKSQVEVNPDFLVFSASSSTICQFLPHRISLPSRPSVGFVCILRFMSVSLFICLSVCLLSSYLTICSCDSKLLSYSTVRDSLNWFNITQEVF